MAISYHELHLAAARCAFVSRTEGTLTRLKRLVETSHELGTRYRHNATASASTTRLVFYVSPTMAALVRSLHSNSPFCLGAKGVSICAVRGFSSASRLCFPPSLSPSLLRLFLCVCFPLSLFLSLVAKLAGSSHITI